MLIDTHTHLYDDSLGSDLQDEMIQRALQADVKKMLMPNCDQHTIPGMMRISEAFPGVCLPMMGLHPTYVKADYEQELTIIHDWLEKSAFVAVGEIGLDYYWDKTFLEQQKICFKTQIGWAIDKDLPIVIHSRESTRDCIDIVSSLQNGKLRGVFHCFSGSMEEANEIAELGFLLGIGGAVTYKSNKVLQEIVRTLPLDKMVLETDAPYLSPVPFRGKKNESRYISFVAEKLALLRECSMEEVAEVTTGSASKLFGI